MKDSVKYVSKEVLKGHIISFLRSHAVRHEKFIRQDL